MKNLLIRYPNGTIFLCLDCGPNRNHFFYSYNWTTAGFEGLYTNNFTFKQVEEDIISDKSYIENGMVFTYTLASTPEEVFKLHPEFFI